LEILPAANSRDWKNRIHEDPKRTRAGLAGGRGKSILAAEMNVSQLIVTLAAAGLILTQGALAQTTNFTPRPPPRNCDAHAQMHFVPIDEILGQKDDEQHPFLPETGQRLGPPPLQPVQTALQETPSKRTREKKKDDDDNPERRMDVRTILAGREEDKSIAHQWNGLARDVLKQRSSSHGQKSSDGQNKRDTEKNDDPSVSADAEDGASLALRDSSSQSLWRRSHNADGSPSRASGVPAESADSRSQLPGYTPPLRDAGNSIGHDYSADGGFHSDDNGPAQRAALNAERDGPAPARIAARDEGTIGGQPGNSLMSSDWKSGAGGLSSGQASPAWGASPFAQLQSSPQGSPLFSQDGGSIFSRGDAGPRSLDAPLSPSAGRRLGDETKKPSALPW
jgi:hypothetical protein